MARTALQKVYADFRQGFVTVANPLAYPEGSVKDITNFDLQDNGTLRKRAGLRYTSEDFVNTGISLSTLSTYATNVYVWENVNQDAEVKLAVIQIGNKIYFYSMLEEGIDTSAPAYSTITIDEIGSATRSKKMSFTSGAGSLFVTHPGAKPKRISVIEGDLDVVDIDLRARDLLLWEGRTQQDTGFEESSTMMPWHEYNLRNSGWPYLARVTEDKFTDDVTTDRKDPVDWMRQKLGRYPKISEPYYVGRHGLGTSVGEQNAFSPWMFESNYLGTSFIPRGRNFINVASFTRDGRGSDSRLHKRYSWTSNPSVTEFYADRVWYAGAKGYAETTLYDSVPVGGLILPPPKKDNIDVSGTIYFSQQIGEDLNRASKCYQDNDPTDEDINQLLATDGGSVSIKGLGEIIDMKVFGTALIIFSTQGVWAISGLDGNVFKADSFSVNKISNKGPVAGDAIAASNNALYYLADDAIYLIVQDQVSAQPTTQDISSEKIKNYYTDISTQQKQTSKVLYDTSARKLYIFYSDVDPTSYDYPELVQNKCLVYHQDLGSFYKYEVSPDTANYILGGLYYQKNQTTTLTEPVTLDGAPVTLGTDPVVLEATYSTAALNALQMLTFKEIAGTAQFVFSSFTDIDTMQDWGTDYTARVQFGFDSAGDIMRDSLKAPTIISHMEKTETGFELDDSENLVLSNRSSCILSTGWDWATSYGRPQELYRFNRNYTPSGTEDTFDYGTEVITTRNRIRGKGYSLGVQLDSPAGKDARILGIGLLYTMAQRV